ncbi:MAG: hypothetical protein ACOVRN_00825 [Flavobacterium sp.]
MEYIDFNLFIYIMNTRKTKRHEDYFKDLDLVNTNRRLVTKTKNLTEKTKRLKSDFKRTFDDMNALKKEKDSLERRLQALETELAHTRKTMRVKSKSSSSTKRANTKSSKSNKSSPKGNKASPKSFEKYRNYITYLKMKKMGNPMPAIRQKMMMARVPEPTEFDLESLNRDEIQEILNYFESNPIEKQKPPSPLLKLTNTQLKKTIIANKPPSITNTEVNNKYTELMNRIDGYPGKETIENFIGVDNETRKNENKMKFINLITKLIDNGTITQDTGAMKTAKVLKEEYDKSLMK